MGNTDYIKRLITECSHINIKKITFQIIDPDDFALRDYSKYDFSKIVYIEQTKWEEIYNFCNEKSIEFIPCFLDLLSFNRLKHLKFEHIKIHSTDLFNINLIKQICNYNPSKIIVETQVCNLHEIEIALKQFDSCSSELILFHGFSDYPTKYEDQNLNMLTYLKERFKLKVGFADHTLSTDVVPLMAIAAGADYIEKHITIKRREDDFDSKVSLQIEEFSMMLKNIYDYEPVIGDSIKYPVENELKYKSIIHKKPILARGKNKSEIVTEEDLLFKRANYGIPAGYKYCYINKKLKNNKKCNEILDYHDFVREKLVICLVARLKSQRLHEKVLRQINGKSLIEILIQRLRKVSPNIEVVLATSFLPEDRPLAQICEKIGIEVYLGDPLNVLDRLINICENKNADGVIRVTGDNVLTDFKLTSLMVDEFLKNDEIEYIRTNNLPLGISPEIFSLQLLYKIYDNMGNPNTSEYLTIYANIPEKYNVGVIKLNNKYNKFNNHLSVDTIDDFNYVCKISQYNNNNLVDLDIEKITEYLSKNPVNEEEVMNKRFKLPNGISLTYKDFCKELNDKELASKVFDYQDRCFL